MSKYLKIQKILMQEESFLSVLLLDGQVFKLLEEQGQFLFILSNTNLADIMILVMEGVSLSLFPRILTILHLQNPKDGRSCLEGFLE